MAGLRDQVDATERAISLGYHRPPDDPAKRHCRWCGGPVPKGRFSWCSQKCVDEALLRAQPGYARRQVEKRDHGVCSACGLDCARLERLVSILACVAHASVRVERDSGRVCTDWDTPWEWSEHPAAAKRREHLEIALAILALWAGHDLRKWDVDVVQIGKEWVRRTRVSLKHSLWQMDHVKPVVEGGGSCGLDNLQSLCLRCHKVATAKLAGRRKGKR